MRKKSLSTALLALLTASAYAQGGDGIAGITEATSMVTSKTAASWFGACIFLILVGTVLESFFF